MIELYCGLHGRVGAGTDVGDADITACRQSRIALEECGLPHRLVRSSDPGDLPRELLGGSAGADWPALLDPRGPDSAAITVRGAGSILIYLAGKTGRWLPDDTRGRYEVLQWLLFAETRLGPTLLQGRSAQQAPLPARAFVVERAQRELRQRLDGLEQRLACSAYLGGPAYSIADMAAYAWLCDCSEAGSPAAAWPRLRAWLLELSRRPAVQRGCAMPTPS